MEVLGKDDLVDRLMKKAGLNHETAGKAVESTIRALRDSLAEGKRVVLPDFATMHVAEQKAQVVRDPETGRQFVLPASRFISVTPDSEFKKELGGAKLPAILLVVQKRDSFAKVVEFHFSRVGWNVQVVNSAAECEESLARGPAFLCVIDYGVPGAQSLVQHLKTNRKTSKIPLILLFPEGCDPERADEFRVCGDQHLVEPFEIYALLALAESELARASSEKELTFEQEVFVQFPTTEDNLDVAGQLVREILKESGIDEDKRVAIDAAFREGMLNAAQHGNRYNSEYQIKVLYRLYSDRIMIVVADEGHGFNHSIYLTRSKTGDAVAAARERYEQGRLGGLGIMLMTRCTDCLEYNEQGNVIILTKNL